MKLIRVVLGLGHFKTQKDSYKLSTNKVLVLVMQFEPMHIFLWDKSTSIIN